MALIGLGVIAEEIGDAAGAERHYRGAQDAWTAIQATSDLAEVLLRLGCLFRRQGRDDEARTNLSEAAAGARAFGSARIEVLARAHLALLSGGAGEAWERYVVCEPRLSLAARMEARFLLWKATGDRSHLAAASDLLAALRDHAPEEHRAGLVERVALYREIAAAVLPAV
jgi:hypothetical protein